MGWTAYYQVLRDRPLADDEVRGVAELLRAERKRPWDAERFAVKVARTPRADRVVAHGWNKLSTADGSCDPALLEAALAALHALIGGELRVRDDFGALGRGERPVQVAMAELEDPEALAPPIAAPLDAHDLDVPALIEKLAGAETREHVDELRARLAACDAREVTVAVYARYRSTWRSAHVRRALGDALARLPDAAAVAPAFLMAWRAPEGTYFYGDMPLPDAFRRGLARVPEVLAQLAADLAAAERDGASELDCRCAERAISVLALAPEGRRALVEAIRRLRGRARSTDLRLRVFAPAHRALAEHGDLSVVPTLLHFLGTAKQVDRSVLAGVVRLAPERARPHVLALAEAGVHRARMIELLRALGGDRERALAGELEARAAAPLEQRIVDSDRELRRAALSEVSRRKDPALLVTLIVTEALDRAIAARVDDALLAFGWRDWEDILPPQLVRAPAADKLAWAEGEGRAVLPPQIVWPCAAAIRELGIAAAAAAYPSQSLAFDAATLAALEAEEAAPLAT